MRPLALRRQELFCTPKKEGKMAKQKSGWAAGLGGKGKPDLEMAKAWYSSPEYKDYMQAQARATGGGITGFDQARMNAPMEIRKQYEKRIADEKKLKKMMQQHQNQNQNQNQNQEPAPTTPTNNIQGLMGSYPRLGAPVLPPLPTGTLTLPTAGQGGMPQLPQLQMPPTQLPQQAAPQAQAQAQAAPAPAAPMTQAPAVAGGLDLKALQNAIAQRQAAARAAPALPTPTAQPMLGMPPKMGA
jgi:hypothetical protein